MSEKVFSLSVMLYESLRFIVDGFHKGFVYFSRISNPLHPVGTHIPTAFWMTSIMYNGTTLFQRTAENTSYEKVIENRS